MLTIEEKIEKITEDITDERSEESPLPSEQSEQITQTVPSRLVQLEHHEEMEEIEQREETKTQMTPDYFIGSNSTQQRIQNEKSQDSLDLENVEHLQTTQPESSQKVFI
jgi:hypothetical protein